MKDKSYIFLNSTREIWRPNCATFFFFLLAFQNSEAKLFSENQQNQRLTTKRLL